MIRREYTAFGMYSGLGSGDKGVDWAWEYVQACENAKSPAGIDLLEIGASENFCEPYDGPAGRNRTCISRLGGACSIH